MSLLQRSEGRRDSLSFEHASSGGIGFIGDRSAAGGSWTDEAASFMPSASPVRAMSSARSMPRRQRKTTRYAATVDSDSSSSSSASESSSEAEDSAAPSPSPSPSPASSRRIARPRPRPRSSTPTEMIERPSSPSSSSPASATLSPMECGTLPHAHSPESERSFYSVIPFFGSNPVETYTASSDPLRRVLVRASALAEAEGVATNKVGMYLSRRKHLEGLFQATTFLHKPPGRTGLKMGGYFVSMQVCEQFRRHYANASQGAGVRERKGTKEKEKGVKVEPKAESKGEDKPQKGRKRKSKSDETSVQVKEEEMSDDERPLQPARRSPTVKPRVVAPRQSPAPSVSRKIPASVTVPTTQQRKPVPVVAQALSAHQVLDADELRASKRARVVPAFKRPPSVPSQAGSGVSSPSCGSSPMPALLPASGHTSVTATPDTHSRILSDRPSSSFASNLSDSSMLDSTTSTYRGSDFDGSRPHSNSHSPNPALPQLVGQFADGEKTELRSLIINLQAKVHSLISQKLQEELRLRELLTPELPEASFGARHHSIGAAEELVRPSPSPEPFASEMDCSFAPPFDHSDLSLLPSPSAHLKIFASAYPTFVASPRPWMQ